VITRSLSDVPGSRRVVAPAAMITFLAERVSAPPASSATSIVLASLNVPQPLNVSIWFFFIRNWTPLTSRPETWRLRLKAVP